MSCFVIFSSHHFVVEVLGAQVDVGSKHFCPVIICWPERGRESGDGGSRHGAKAAHARDGRVGKKKEFPLQQTFDIAFFLRHLKKPRAYKVASVSASVSVSVSTVVGRLSEDPTAVLSAT